MLGILVIFISLILNFATPDLRILSFTFFACALVSVIVIAFSVTVTLFFDRFLGDLVGLVGITITEFQFWIFMSSTLETSSTPGALVAYCSI